MSRSTSLTTGPVSASFRRLAVPSAIAMLFATLYNVVDTWFAGRISTDAQAGLSVTFQAFFLLIASGVGLKVAMSSMVASAIGAGDEAGAKRIAMQGLMFSAVLAIALGVGGIWGGPAMIALVSEPGAYRDAGVAYINIILIGAGPFLITFCANGLLEAQGEAEPMKRAQIGSFFANCALNPLFIYGVPGLVPGAGFDGIAIATVTSQTGVMIYIFSHLRRSELMEGAGALRWRPDLAAWRGILAQAAPVTGSMLIMIIAMFVVQYYLKSFGPAALAAYGVALRIEQIILLPGLGVTGALLPIAAQSFGAKRYDRVREAAMFCCKTAGGMMLCGSVILWLAGGALMTFFTRDAEVIRIGSEYLLVEGFILPLYIVLFAMNSLLQALRRPMMTVWIGLWRQGLAVALFCTLFIHGFGMDETGVWLGIAAAVTTGFALSLTVSIYVARREIGGLFTRSAAAPAG